METVMNVINAAGAVVAGVVFVSVAVFSVVSLLVGDLLERGEVEEAPAPVDLEPAA